MERNKSFGLFIFTIGTFLSYYSISKKRRNIQKSLFPRNKGAVKCHVLDLPFEVLQIVGEFFQCDTSILDKLKYEESWRNFLNSTKKLCYDIPAALPISLLPSFLCSSLKKQSIHLSLNNIISLSYASDPSFRNQVLSKLNNPLKQLELSIFSLTTGFPFKSTEDSIAPSVESLTPAFLHLSNLYCLNLHYCDINNKDLLNLCNIHTLKLLNCQKLTDISFLFSENTDYVKENHTTDNNIRKTSNLNPKGIHSLYIYDCDNLVNGFNLISSKFFYYVNHTTHSLPDFFGSSSLEHCIIAQCFELCDITSIRGMKNLTIIDCPSLYTINHVQDMDTFRVINCDNLFSLFSISDINECVIRNCLTISTVDLLEFQGLQGLIIEKCPEIRCLLINQSVKCIGLKDLKNLKEVFIDIPLSAMRFQGYNSQALTVNLLKDVQYLIIPSFQNEQRSISAQDINASEDIHPLFQGNGKINIKKYSKGPRSTGLHVTFLSESYESFYGFQPIKLT
jgi:hypothetical protein